MLGSGTVVMGETRSCGLARPTLANLGLGFQLCG